LRSFALPRDSIHHHPGLRHQPPRLRPSPPHIMQPRTSPCICDPCVSPVAGTQAANNARTAPHATLTTFPRQIRPTCASREVPKGVRSQNAAASTAARFLETKRPIMNGHTTPEPPPLVEGSEPRRGVAPPPSLVLPMSTAGGLNETGARKGSSGSGGPVDLSLKGTEAGGGARQQTGHRRGSRTFGYPARLPAATAGLLKATIRLRGSQARSRLSVRAGGTATRR